jgi:nucleoside-diphosphate-sugar epimerase
VLDPHELARALHAYTVPVPPGVLRAAADVTWRLHLQPTPAGWVDLALSVPVLDSGRARRELGWAPAVSSTDALLDLLDGFAHLAGGTTPALARHASRPRAHEEREAAVVRA